MALIDNDQSLIVDFLLRAGGAILVVIVGRLLGRLSRRWVGQAIAKTTLSNTLKELAVKVTNVVVEGSVIILALAVLGVPIGTLITAVGIVVVVLGIALQASISNFAATVIFMLFEPFKVGDMIETGSVVGQVNELQVFNTVLYQRDGKVVSLPNSRIQNDGVINYSKTASLRVDVEVGISYEDDLDKAKQVAYDFLAADPRVLKDPPARVIVLGLGDSSVNLGIRPFVSSEDYWSMRWSLTEQIKRSFDEAGITIPFPQRDVHVLETNSDLGN